jgi:nucleotide-binding universal stress UspA family protein
MAYAFRGRVDITPIHYVYQDGWLFARTSHGAKMDVLEHSPWVAFEVDELESVFDWRSVVVHGAAYVMPSDGSLIAVRAGQSVADDGATLVLAYVEPMSGFLADEGEARIHAYGVEAGFAKLRAALAEGGVKSDHVVLHHGEKQTPAQALLEYADDVRSDLVTAGSVQHSRLDRWMVGSVSAELVREGRRSVLIVPPLQRG